MQDNNVEAASRRFGSGEVTEPRQGAASTSGDFKESRRDAASTIGYFDPEQPVGELSGNLPHWRQEGATYFVTFRTADSIPQEKIDLWKREQKDWLERHPEPLSEQQRREYFEKFVVRIHRWLDHGFGSCLLKQPELRKIVVDALLHFDRDRYELRGWVVMPNHVHIVVSPWGEHDLSEILHSWKSFTAKQINKTIGATGAFWQKESFDHIVRSPESLERIERYMAHNPDDLAEGSYTLSESMQTRRDASTQTRQDAAST